MERRWDGIYATKEEIEQLEYNQNASMLFITLFLIALLVALYYIFLATFAVLVLTFGIYSIIAASFFLFKNCFESFSDMLSENHVDQSDVPLLFRIKNYYFYRSYNDLVIYIKCSWSNTIDYIRDKISSSIDKTSKSFLIGFSKFIAELGMVVIIPLLSNFITVFAILAYLVFLVALFPLTGTLSLLLLITRTPHENPYLEQYGDSILPRLKMIDTTHIFWGVGFVFMLTASFLFSELLFEKLPFADNLINSFQAYISGIHFSGNIQKIFDNLVNMNFINDAKDVLLSLYATLIPVTLLAAGMAFTESLWNLITCRRRGFADQIKVNAILSLTMVWLGITGVQFAFMYNMLDKRDDISLPAAASLYEHPGMQSICQMDAAPFNCVGQGREWVVNLLDKAGVSFTDKISSPVPELVKASSDRRNKDKGSWVNKLNENWRISK